MIFSKVENPKKSSTKAARVSGVVSYITAPENKNALEKCIYHQAVNFISDDLKSQSAEMIALAQEAVKSKDPIEHFVISWKSHERPTPEQAREAAAILVKQCGLVGHQYVIALHDDTDNMHLHIAVNRVHPDTCKVVKINKGFDKEAGHQAIAIIEKVQGWSVEENARYRTNDKAELIIDPATKRPQIFENLDKQQQQPSAKAQAMEVQTGEKSAQRIGIENAAPIIASATSWKDLHARMHAAGMQYQRKGSGAVVQVGDELVKASDVARTASLTALQKRFGPYQPPQEINPNEYHHHTKEPHPIAFGNETGHGLRNLSECNLAVLTNQGQTRSSGVLHIDARPGRRPADRLRRTAGRDNSTGLTPRPMRQGQPGWNEYIAIRDAQKTAKTLNTIELQKRHGDERAALAAKQKAERAELFSGNWQGKGVAKNALQSITATQQAAEKLELSERQRDERKALHAQYKPMQMYKQWKEQPLIVSEYVRPLIDQHIELDRQSPRLSQILKSLSHTTDQRHHTTYTLNGKSVFRDEGRTIQVLDLTSEAGIAAAIATAQQKFGNVLTLTGSLEFQQNAVAVAVNNGLTCKFADPALDKLREELQKQKYQAERDAARAERERAAAAQLEKAKALTPAIPPIQPIRQQPEIDPGHEYSGDEHTEIDYLDDIYRQIEIEATADKYSPLHNPAVQATDEGHQKYIESRIFASNDQFIAVIVGKQVQILKTEILNQNVEYEGHAEGVNRYAVGNEVSIAPQSDGSTKTVISEEREAMQTEAKRERDNGHGL